MLQLRTMNQPIESAEEAVMLPELTAASTKTTDPHGVRESPPLHGTSPLKAVGVATSPLRVSAAFD
jgi:hypothetical protein